jgi:hypothetical protein
MSVSLKLIIFLGSWLFLCVVDNVAVSKSFPQQTNKKKLVAAGAARNWTPNFFQLSRSTTTHMKMRWPQ